MSLRVVQSQSLLLLAILLLVGIHNTLAFTTTTRVMFLGSEPFRLAKFRALSQLRSASQSNSDDLVARLPLLEAEYASCKEDQDTTRAELIAGDIENAKTAAELGVRATQLRFYEAFTKQDIDAMRDVWSKEDDVRCVHPGMSHLQGYDRVMNSWKQIFSSAGDFTIQPSQTKINCSGQTALCSCVEETTGGGQIECLNVYRRESGSWKMILHFASPIFSGLGQGLADE